MASVNLVISLMCETGGGEGGEGSSGCAKEIPAGDETV